jgi:hypothetical protein
MSGRTTAKMTAHSQVVVSIVKIRSHSVTARLLRAAAGQDWTLQVNFEEQERSERFVVVLLKRVGCAVKLARTCCLIDCQRFNVDLANSTSAGS